MEMSRVVYMRGSDEWWLSKQRKNGREVYPKRILVGKLGKERRYIPCKWPMDDAAFASAIEGLSDCGDIETSHFNADCMLSAFLRSVGYGKTADAYDGLDKWYSQQSQPAASGRLFISGAEMDIPDSVCILGVPYEVVTCGMEDGEDGSISPRMQRITLREGLCEAKRTQVYLHELVHGILDQLGYADLYEDEHLVQGLAIGLHQALRSD